MREGKSFAIVVLAVLFLSCQSLPYQEITKENEITKQIRIFSNEVAQKIYKLKPVDSKILIMDFTDLKERFTYLGTYISDKLAEEIAEIEGIKLINRANLELVMDELSFQQSGFVSEKDVLRIGSFAGANILITGTITDLGNELDVSMDITEIEKSEMEPASFRIEKTSKIMALISAIIDVEEKKAQELKEEIERLQNEIEQRKHALQNLLVNGAAEIEDRLKAEEEQKRRELDNLYASKRNQIEQRFQREEELKKRELASIERQIREKSEILKALKVKQKELRTYEDMINNIEAQIARRNNIEPTHKLKI